MSTDKTYLAEPKLQAPGAGLPFSQRIFLKWITGPILSKRKSPAECRADYERLVDKFIQKASQVPAELRATRVLVEPMAGLEDSSRFWSLSGVAEHLLIVSRGMESIILSLSAGKIPGVKADVAAVKPRHQEDSLGEYVNYAPALMKRIDDRLAEPGMNFHSPLKFVHPWFGGITARQWYWLLSAHQGIHYRQAKSIIEKLPKK